MTGVTMAIITTGCINLKSGVITLDGSSLNPIQNCPLPNNAVVARIERKMASASQTVGEDFCTNIQNYSCSRRIFSPETTTREAVEQECTKVEEFGGSTCMSLPSHYFDTREAAKRDDTSSIALQPGGEYNRSEYQCHQNLLKDGDDYLAVAQGDDLREALMLAQLECTGIAPRLSAMQQGAKK